MDGRPVQEGQDNGSLMPRSGGVVYTVYTTSESEITF